MLNIMKLNNIVLEALQARGYSQTEAEQFITQITIHNDENIGIKERIEQCEHHNGKEIDTFV